MKLSILSVLFFIVNSGHAASVKGLDKDGLRKKYAYLYQQKIVKNEDGSLSFHKARLLRKEGFNVLYLHGDQFEMGFQHGALLKDQIASGAVPQAAKLIPNTVRNALGEGAVAKLLAKGIDQTIAQPMLDYTVDAAPENKLAISAAFALSEATGIPMETYIDAMLAPEVLMLLAKLSMSMGDFPKKLIPTNMELLNNCTGFTVWGPYSKNRSMIVARNLDFPLTSRFDRHPTLIYFDSTDGGQKYLSVATAGTHNVAITAMNESGLFIALHTLPTAETSVKAVPLFITGGKVLREARTFDQAVEMFKATPPPTGWTYDLISTREGRVGSVEITNQHVEVRESTNGYHVQANHFLTPPLLDKMLFINKSVDADTFARYARAEQMIQDRAGVFTKVDAMRVLSDQTDPFSGKIRGVGNTVAVETTVGSTILVPEEGRIYVAKGTAPVSHNGYVAFPTPDRFDPDTLLAQENSTLPESSFGDEHPKMASALKLFIKAKEAFEYQNDSKGAFELMKKVTAVDSTNPHYYFVQAILALRAGLLSESQSALDLVSQYALWPHHKHLAHYYKARIFASKNQAAAAADELNMLTDDSRTDPKLRDAARRLRSKLRFRSVVPIAKSSLPLMIQQGDMEHY